MAQTLGKCIELDSLSVSMSHSGTATVTWTPSGPKNGTFNVTIPKGSGCSGGSGSGGAGAATLNFKGCGRIRVNVDGQGNGGGLAFTNAFVRHSVGGFGTNVLEMVDAGGGSDCGTVGLEIDGDGSNPVEINVRCGHAVTLSFGNATFFGLNGAVQCDFVVEVLE